MPPDPDSHTDASERPRPRWRRWLHRLLQVLGGVAALVVTLTLVLLLILQTSWGGQAAVQFIAQYANPFTNATIHVESVDGNWLQTLELRDVSLVPTDAVPADTTQRFAHLDTLRVRYSLPALLRSTLHVREVALAGPSASLYQQSDSTWVLPTLSPTEPAAAPDTAALSFVIQVDAVRIRRGQVTARFYTPRGDSVLHVRDLQLGARDIRYASPLTGRLDTLGLDALLPGRATPVQLQAAGTLHADRLMLDGLRLTSRYSDVRGRGMLRLAQTTQDALDDVDFTLEAAPLSFRDLAPFMPTVGLNPDADLRLDVQADGSGGLLQLRTEAALSTGGSLTLDATATPLLPTDVERTTPEPLRYRLDAQARALNTAAFAPADSAAPTRLNSDVQIDLEGPALNQLSGTVSARLFDTQVTGYALQSTDLQLAFTNGEAAINGQGDFAGAAFTVGGTMAPFAARPSYDIQTDVSDFNIGAFTEGTGLSSTLNTQFRLTGEGVARPGADLSAQLDVLPSMLNEQRIRAGRITARLRRDTLTYDSQLTFPEGQWAVAGMAQLTDPLTYTIDQGRFEAVDIAALMGDTTASALNGSFSLSGQGTAPDALRLQAEAQLQDSYYGGYVLRAAASRLALERGQANLSATADMEGGQFEFAATTTPFTASPTLQVTQGQFRNVDLGPLLQDSTQQSALNGSFSLRGEEWTGESMGQWTAQATLDTSRLNQQPIQAAQLDATLQQARVDATLHLDTPAGQSRFVGYAQPFDDVPTYALTEGTLTALDLGALAGLPSARTTLNGSLTAEGRGIDPATLSLETRLALDTSRVNQAMVERGLLQARLDQGEGTLSSQFEFAQGEMTFAATARPEADRPSYRLQGRVSDVNAAALAGVDSLDSRVSLNIDLEGTGFDPSSLQFTGRVSSPFARYATARLDTLDARLEMRDGLLRVDTLLAQTNVGTVRGGGQVAISDPTNRYASNFFVEAQTTDISALRSALGVRQLSLDEGRFEGRIYGTPGTVRFDVLTTLTNLTYDNLVLADAEAQIAGARGDTTAVSALELRGRVGFLSYSTVSVEDTQFDARYEDQTIDFSSTLTVDRERDARVAGTVDLRPGRERMVLQTFDARLGPDQWTLLQDASIAYGDAYRISNLLLYSNQQQLAADGVVDFDGQQSLIVTLESIEIDAFTDLLGFEGLGGRLSGTLDMSGAAQNPQITGSLNLGVRSFDEEVGQLRLNLNYDSLRTRLDARLVHRDGSTLTMEGTIPADLRLSAQDTSNVMNDPVDLTLVAETFSIGWIDPFVDPALAQDITGQLDADATIGGTLDTPALSGSGTVRNGQLDLTELGTTYDRISADLDFDGEQVRVRQAEVRSEGGGRLQAEGTIDLTDLTLGAYDLVVTTTDFLAIDTREYRARVDSELDVLGTTERPEVRGSAQVESADIYLVTSADSESELATVQLSEDDRQTIERRFGIRLTEADTTTFDAYEALAMDLTVQFERDTWIRSRSNPKMNIQFTGNLDVQKEAFEDVQVFGTIEVIPDRSRVVQFGKEFQITEGVLTFNGPPEEPVMDIQATYGVRARASQENEATITLSVGGRPEDLDLALSSTPPMDTNNILSYLAVGRPADQLLGGSSGGGTGQDLAESIALGQAAGIIENLAAARLGLDVVRIEPTPDGSIFLTAGQYLSPRFYAAVQQSITDEPGEQVTNSLPDITLEYQFTRWLLIRTLYRNPDLRMNLLWEYAY